MCPLKTREWKCVLLKGANVEDDKSEFVLCQGANGKAEWKRYKQYTRNDIMAAIEEVKTGKLEQSPLVKWATFFCLGAVFLSPGGPLEIFGDIWCRSLARCFLGPKVS